jgi:transcriptional regulator with XRE-family HTH domain
VELSERIQRWREGLKVGVPKLAKALGVTRSAIYQWESGEADPTHKHVTELVAALGISLPEFWGTPPRKRRAA